MDLMRILRALEEFLYELVGWLVFYPRTFWRIMRDPPASARYALRELTKPSSQQFIDSVSPVLMLILSVVVAHGIELASHEPIPDIGTPMGQRLFATEQGLMITRSVVFSAYALGAALVTLRRQHSTITRDTLRAPFAVQAFLISPFVIGLSVGTMLIQRTGAGSHLAGVLAYLLAITWYVWARISTYHALTDAGWLRSTAVVSATFLATTVLLLTLGAVLIL